LSQSAAATIHQSPAADLGQRAPADRAQALLARFHEVRSFTAELSRGLEPEDCDVQSMPDVSPTK